MKRMLKADRDERILDIQKGLLILDNYSQLECDIEKWKVMNKYDTFLMNLLNPRMKNQYFPIDTKDSTIGSEGSIRYLDNRARRIRSDLYKVLYN